MKDRISIEKDTSGGWQYAVDGHDGVRAYGWTLGTKAEARKEAVEHICRERARHAKAVTT